MKKHFYAIMDSEGRFLTEFKTNGRNALAFDSTWSRNIEDALINPLEEQLEHLKLWAPLVDGQVVVIEAKYSFESLDGEPLDVEAIQEKNKPVDPFKQSLDYLEELFGRGEKNEREN